MSKRLWIMLWVRALELKALQAALAYWGSLMPKSEAEKLWTRQLWIIEKYFTQYKPHPIFDDLLLGPSKVTRIE